jgi:kumamolisin
MAFERRVALAGSHRDPVPGATRQRSVGGDEIVHATIVLRRSTQSAPLDSGDAFSYAGGTTTPYRSREEFSASHGAGPSDLALIDAFAREFGLTITEKSQPRRSVVISGSADAMQKAFGMSLAYYDSPRGVYRGRTGNIQIPSELEGVVTAVLGLDNRPVAKSHIRRPNVTPPVSFTPVQVSKAYGFPAGSDGSGQTIGIIELGGGYQPSDLKTYFAGLNLSVPAVSAVSVDGGMNQPGADQNADGEVMLDIEVAGAIAPGARIVVYFAPNTDQGFHDAITTAVHDTANNPSVVSISWGGPEDSWTDQSRSAMLAAVTDAAAVGVTIIAAAGDDGSSDGLTDNKLHVDLPACLPPVLACGGTRLNVANGSVQSEVVWNELAKQEGATGGGVSRFFALPSYQNSAGVPPHPETKFVGRGVPDVSGDADPETGYSVLVDGQSSVIGGTSAVAPLWAGLIALLNQQLGKNLGFVNPLLYRVGSAAFRDITSGNNGHYQAGKNWDACTGLGSPNGTALGKALSSS